MIAFLGTQNDSFDFVLFFVSFWSHRHISKQCFLYFRQAFFVHFMYWSACGFHLLHECFFESWKTKFWFRIVFYSIFEPWAHLETVFFICFVFLWANVVFSCMTAFSSHWKRKYWFRLFLIAFFSRGHLSKRSLIQTFFSFVRQMLYLD